MANHNNNNNSGLEYISIYIPLDDETRAERKEIVADAALELQGYDLQIKAFKATLEDKIKAAKAKHTQALLELKTNQFALEGDYISYVNETNRRMEYYDPRPDADGALILVASRPLSTREIRQFKIDFREQIAQN